MKTNARIKSRAQNKNDCPTEFGSSYNKLLSALKSTSSYSEEERSILAKIFFFLMESPEKLYLSWVDTPGYLKDYGPLRDQFILANRLNRRTQSDIVMYLSAAPQPKSTAASKLEGPARMVCYNFMALPGL